MFGRTPGAATVDAMPKPLPNLSFSDPAAAALWAALQTLDESTQLQVLGSLRSQLAVPEDRPTSAARRQAVAIAALREVAEHLGHAPSVEQYRQFRSEHPELVSDGALRHSLGGHWANALREAGLDAPPESTAIVVPTSQRYTPAQAIAVVKECANELGEVPSYTAYRRWLDSPEIAARPGARPSSLPTFYRLFGNWSGALVAAELVKATGLPRAIPSSARADSVVFTYTLGELTGILVEMAALEGRPPRRSRYDYLREQILAKAAARGEIRRIPTRHALTKAFGTWDDALRVAGVLEPDRSVTAKRPIPDAEIIGALREGHRAIGEPFTAARYEVWAREQRARRRQAGTRRAFPSCWVVERAFGCWADGVRAALGNANARDAAHDRAPQ